MTSVLAAPQHVDEPPVAPEPITRQRFPTGVVVVSVAVSIALRARFVTTPLTSDEGGYLAVARAWASGKGLYTDAWVDRPQGLLVLFRAWDAVTGGSTAAIRVMAILVGCLAVIGVAYTVFALAGRRAAAIASVLVAVASTNARIEGFIANGELLAGGVAAVGVAAACAYMFRGRGRSWLLISGVLAGCAISIKQSGFDGFLAVMVCLVAGGITGERTWRQVARDCAICAAGLASVLAALLVHGLILGFHAWWYALGRLSTGWDQRHVTLRLAPVRRNLANCRADDPAARGRGRRRPGDLAGAQSATLALHRPRPGVALLRRDRLRDGRVVPPPLLGDVDLPARCRSCDGPGHDHSRAHRCRRWSSVDRRHHLPGGCSVVDQHDARRQARSDRRGTRRR